MQAAPAMIEAFCPQYSKVLRNGGFYMEILRVENLKKVYGSGENEVRALDGISFSVEQGEFLAII